MRATASALGSISLDVTSLDIISLDITSPEAALPPSPSQSLSPVLGASLETKSGGDSSATQMRHMTQASPRQRRVFTSSSAKSRHIAATALQRHARGRRSRKHSKRGEKGGGKGSGNGGGKGGVTEGEGEVEDGKEDSESTRGAGSRTGSRSEPADPVDWRKLPVGSAAVPPTAEPTVWGVASWLKELKLHRAIGEALQCPSETNLQFGYIKSLTRAELQLLMEEAHLGGLVDEVHRHTEPPRRQVYATQRNYVTNTTHCNITNAMQRNPTQPNSIQRSGTQRNAIPHHTTPHCGCVAGLERS